MILFSKDPALRKPLLIALALSLGAAISLGLSRFSYALLLPPMRVDLGWSYQLAGEMNTANASGYLIGALMTPAIMRRFGAQAALIGGALLTALFMLLSGFVIDDDMLLLQRALAGVASAFIFISGGVLAARLGALHPRRAGLLIGLYYGGTGFGIVLSALAVPVSLHAAATHGAAHAWQWAWLALGGVCLLMTLGMAPAASHIDGSTAAAGAHGRFRIHSFCYSLGGYFLVHGATHGWQWTWLTLGIACLLMARVMTPAAIQRSGPAVPRSGDGGFRIRSFGYGLAGYFMFGVGYIGYMTFVIALLKEQGMRAPLITLFYTLLGLAVVASSRIWAGMLDRYKGGQSLAILNALLAGATLLPVLTAAPFAVFASGLLFGAVFLSVVASTTALVRHNVAPHAWSSGISVFTIVFAFGQIVGPSIVGWIADGSGGLRHGLVFSAVALLIGALLASRQRALVSVAPDDGRL
jgi:predicted MFS family arabinose efflux permease